MDSTGRAGTAVAGTPSRPAGGEAPAPDAAATAAAADGASHHCRLPFGAELDGGGVRFRLWAPNAERIELILEGDEGPRALPMPADGNGFRALWVAGAGAGSRYRFRVDGGLTVPDPAARAQPDDVHGASEVIDPRAYRWRCRDWRGRPWEETVLYELHVGAFTAEGTFAAAIGKLGALADLGVTAIELMPVADFPGRRDWGYNGAALFAPDASYGRPCDLKALIDAAHGHRLMVFLDVVYNHFGPVGNYLHTYAAAFFRGDRQTPWGAAIAFDGADAATVRSFFIANALYWIDEYRIDGLRLDAVHAIRDDARPSFLDALATGVRDLAARQGRHVHLVVEDDDNRARPLAAARDGSGGGYEAQWNDDLHHALHVLLTGEGEGYYADYADRPVAHLARGLAEGFVWQGEPSPYRGGARRGEPSRGLPATAFINFLQNHDQIGNRALGERLAHLVPAARLREAVALVLLAPPPPLLFMGEEWAAPEPFLFFCDLGDDVAPSVREGRRREFARFAAFADPVARARIPDPCSTAAFARSRLDWRRRQEPRHARMLAHYRRLLAIRQRQIIPRLAGIRPGGRSLLHADGRGLAVAWTLGDGSVLHVLVRFGGTIAPWTTMAAPPGDVLYATGAAAGDGGDDDGGGGDDDGGGDGDGDGRRWWVRFSLDRRPGDGDRS